MITVNILNRCINHITFRIRGSQGPPQHCAYHWFSHRSKQFHNSAISMPFQDRGTTNSNGNELNNFGMIPVSRLEYYYIIITSLNPFGNDAGSN